MRTDRDLLGELRAIDRRGYPAYKSLRGGYDFDDYILYIDHVQGDPFAAPSSLSLFVPAEVTSYPAGMLDEPHRRTALEDLLVRRFARELSRSSFKVGGSGKSGLLATASPGPEVYARSACEVGEDGLTLRFQAGFPAHGRTVDARALETMLFDLVPACAERALLFDDASLCSAQAAIDLADDRHAVRGELERRGLVAFVADGSVLPRASGVSSRPLEGATPFVSPDELAVTLELPHRGAVRGMAVRRGITLVVGGGYHGKSTLLQALQEGVYDHVAGDGRELVITDATAVKLRAEDGRAVRSVDISPFISNLPDGRDTRAFSTLDASGSTSQAAGTVEAVQAGARALLIDEDTSATNFMVRDALMEEVVAAESEPITPFVERVRDLWEHDGVSSVIVVGSSGQFFPIADAVVQMDRYEARDITDRVRAVCRVHGLRAHGGEGGPVVAPDARRLSLRAEASHAGCARGRGGSGRAGDRIKVRPHGRDGFSVADGSVDLRLVEQLVDAEQVSALAQMMRLVLTDRMLDGSRTLAQAVSRVYADLRERGWGALSEHGEPSCGMALPRPQELFACINRWR